MEDNSKTADVAVGDWYHESGFERDNGGFSSNIEEYLSLYAKYSLSLTFPMYLHYSQQTYNTYDLRTFRTTRVLFVWKDCLYYLWNTKR